MKDKQLKYDLLIHISSPPSLDLEPLELGMACIAFDQSVVFVFSGDGTEWLIANQPAKRPQGKSADKLVKALAMYECDEVYYLFDDAHVEQELLVKNATPISASRLPDLILSSKHRLNF